MSAPDRLQDDLFVHCARRTADRYRELGHFFGWRFLTGPRATLAASTQVALVTLNPGGGLESADQTGASYEIGSSYVTESWLGAFAGQAPLQRQVQALLRELMPYLGATGPVDDFLAQRVLTGHYVPFRSPSFTKLHNRELSMEFGRWLWTKVLTEWRPRLILTIDRQGYSGLTEIITACGGQAVEGRCFPTGWGQYVADANRFVGFRSDGVTTLARLPHLSRFALFTEPGYSERRKAPLADFFEWVSGGEFTG